MSLQQIIECDKHMLIRAFNNLVGKLQAETGISMTPLDKEIKLLRTSPELMPYLMPLHAKPAPKAPATARPNKMSTSDASEQPTKYPKGKGKGKGKGKSKSKQGSSIDLPPGCVAKTADGKPLCFAFNKGVCGFRGTGPSCQRGYHLCYKVATKPRLSMNTVIARSDSQPLELTNNHQFHVSNRSLLKSVVDRPHCRVV